MGAFATGALINCFPSDTSMLACKSTGGRSASCWHDEAGDISSSNLRRVGRPHALEAVHPCLNVLLAVQLSCVGWRERMGSRP